MTVRYSIRFLAAITLAPLMTDTTTSETAVDALPLDMVTNALQSGQTITFHLELAPVRQVVLDVRVGDTSTLAMQLKAAKRADLAGRRGTGFAEDCVDCR